MEGNTSSELPRQEGRTEQSFDFGRGRVEFVRSKPDSNVIPLTRKTSLPLLFAQGYGGDKLLPWYVDAFAKTGRDTFGLAFSGERKNNNPKPVQKEGLSIPVPELEYERALDTLDSMDEAGITQSDIVAESAGAMRTLIAVALQPDKFRNVVLVHPAGLDKHGFTSTHGHVVHHQLRSLMDPRLLSERFQRKWRRSTISKEDKMGSREGSGRDRDEQEAVAYAQLEPLLRELKEKHPHLKFSIIADKHDFNFRWRRLQKVNRANLFNFITSRWKGHGIGHKQERVTEIAGLLTQMESSQQTTSTSPQSKEQAALAA